MSTPWLIASLALFSLAACGNVTVDNGTDGAGGSPAGPGGGGPGGNGSGGSGGSACTPVMQGSGGFMQATCDDLSVMTVSDAVVTDDDGDGLVEAGEGVFIEANLNEVAGIGFNWYPGVNFTSNHAGVTVTADDWFYAILPCQTMPVSAHAQVASNVASGTVVTITAQVAMLNTDCPNAYSIDIPMTVY